MFFDIFSLNRSFSITKEKFDGKSLHILHIAAELSSLAKIGGLGEAVYGLLHTSSKSAHVEIILPYYSFIDTTPINSLIKEGSFQVETKNKKFVVESYRGKIHNFSVVLLKESELLSRDKVYGFNDDLSRFLFLSKASLEYLTLRKKPIDILHLHDWHTSACLPLYQQLYLKKGLEIKKTALSIHNLSYQGLCMKKDLTLFGIDPHKLHSNKNLYNLLKEGIILADLVITVSPTYANEILQKEYSCGLYDTLNAHKDKIIGLLNGIDTEVWNPKNDSFLKTSYHQKMSSKKIILSKGDNKTFLLKKLGLKEHKKPLISFIGRLTEQKGLELIEHTINRAKLGEFTFILLGSSQEKKVQDHFIKLQKTFNNNPNISLKLEFNEELAHLIYAASDFLVIPSRFEPCGLVQLIAFHYATIPIARKTGGLRDTIADYKSKDGNGYLFKEYQKEALDECIDMALKNFGSEKHKSLLEHAFCQNYSWDHRIKDYLKTYQILLS